MSLREQAYFGVLEVASAWALLSAVAVEISARVESRVFAWVWAASFGISALAAAYCFWRLL